MKPNAEHLARVRALSESDRRLNVESRLLAVVSGFGGERLVADNPRMPELVRQLADEAEALAREGFIPAPGPTS
jgi:hypothetical protein